MIQVRRLFLDYPEDCLLISFPDDTNNPSVTANQEAGTITIKIKLVERYTHRQNNKTQDPPAKKHPNHKVGQLHIE
jgi:hypothetical protein